MKLKEGNYKKEYFLRAVINSKQALNANPF